MSRQLDLIAPWAHQMMRQVLRPGDLAVDLTAGTGHDTLLLFETVGSFGQVLTFDIQPQALAATQARLSQLRARVTTLECGQPLPMEAGVYLVLAGHEQLAAHLTRAPRVVVASLGSLPGSDGHIVTRPETCLAALEQASQLLATGGRLVVVIYTGHPGGIEEGAVVDHFFHQLPADQWQVLRLQVANRSDKPYLLVAEKTDSEFQNRREQPFSLSPAFGSPVAS